MQQDDNRQEKGTIGGRRVLLLSAVWAIAMLGGLYVFIDQVFWH
ncbi:hypothetical protein [Acidihalobacter aeolianus]|nr:hypothetical protein [Acidihalobacter aeolianus]